MNEYITCSFVDPVEKIHWATFIDSDKERIDSFARYLQKSQHPENILIVFYSDHKEQLLTDYLKEMKD